MRKDIIKLSASLVVSLGLFFLYFDFLTRLAIVADWSALSEIESIILVTQILRAIILAVLGTKYQLQPIIPIIVFSLEALLIPGLLILIIMTGEAYYASLMGLILTAWFGASAIILTPYSSFMILESYSFFLHSLYSFLLSL